MITLENVSKAYSTGAPALNNVSLKIEAGEFVFVVGDSGSGKSTLIKLLLRELLPTSGKIMVNDIDVASLRHKQIPKYRRKLGVVFQDSVLDKPLTVRENLKNRAFFEESTVLTFYTIAGALSALANHDSVAKHSAFYTVDGDIQMGITDVCYATLRVRNHTFETIKEKPDTPRAIMEFKTIDLANALFNGTASTMAELCAGNIYMSGMINMIDNVNRILDRVGMYLG